VRREVLGLVDDDVLLREAPAADVRERLDLELTALEQLADAREPPCSSATAREQELEVVEDGLHPGVELLVDVAGQRSRCRGRGA
jgi:hypothetical protein